MRAKIVNECLFWFHICVIVGAVFVCFFLPLHVVLLAVVIHRAHLFVFRDCLLSKLHRSISGLSREKDFLQFTVERLLGKAITKQQSNYVDYGLVVLVLTIAVGMTVLPVA